jgi:hypothetical protein
MVRRITTIWNLDLVTILEHASPMLTGLVECQLEGTTVLLIRLC